MIEMTDYATRRQALMRHMGEDDVVIMPAALEAVRNGDVTYPYRQQSDFYYLTGFVEPEAILVLLPKRKAGEFVLFNRVRDREHEQWEGPRAGQAGARKQFLADEAYPIEQFTALLPALLAGKKTVYYPLGHSRQFDEVLLSHVHQQRKKNRSGTALTCELVDVMPLIHEMRLFKSPAEIALLQKAVDITAAGHVAAMEACRSGMNECELDAILAYEFKRRGAAAVAYSSIVGAGKNTCVLHYVANNRRISKGDLVLIDAGAEYANYAADITRTFPASGRFSPEQQAIYDIVLEAQLAAIRVIKPGVAWHKPQEVIVKIITEGLKELGILKGRVSDLIEKGAYLPFYMHQSGHWLGLDVHDAGQYKLNGHWRPFKPGMVLTVEPGIYISADNRQVNARWHHIGVRIEDDVLVTKSGHRVLSNAIPKTVSEIETVMGGR